jgi:protein tyrosine phosphatase (PTP) superfamily phosphohydrolase (DUF442 family)
LVAKGLRLLFLAVFLGYVLSLASIYFSYIEPYLFPLRLIQGDARKITNEIIVGPYPHEDDLFQLMKNQRVKVIISLLNPAIPYEESLIEKEEKVAKKLGLTFYNVPLSFLSLNSDSNLRAIDKIREILKKERGKRIYIHCYLGRHRVGLIEEKLFSGK